MFTGKVSNERQVPKSVLVLMIRLLKERRIDV